MTPRQVIADNAKALARTEDKPHIGEMRVDLKNHLHVRESHKPNLSGKMKSVLLSTKNEMREVQQNPSLMHDVLTCKGQDTGTNDLSTIPPSSLSISKDFEDVFPQELPPGLTLLRGIEHRIDLIPSAPLPN
jgi:hypothetical protein